MDRLARSLEGWTPIRVRVGGAEPEVDWAMVEGAFTDPFFEQTADRAMRRPFNQIFARRTPIGALGALSERAPGVAPAGFVFHMSRCGSTLIAQMLSRLSATIVLSEPQPLDALLGLHRGAAVDDATLVAWLRNMMSALGRPRAREQRLFVKFHAWHVLELPLIARAFPGVPWIFAFREPRAVLRSQARSLGPELLPGAVDPAYFGLDAATAAAVAPDEYAARVLAAFCEAALRHADLGRASFVEYADLPGAVFSALPVFGVTPTGEDAERMRAAAQLDTKGPGRPYDRRDDDPEPQGIESVAARWLDAPYAALKAASRAGAVR